MKLVALLLALFAPMAGSAAPIAIVHATAWTMSAQTPMKDATIVVDRGKIVSVVGGGMAPPGAEVIDARGAPVTPGLVNGATQIGLIETGGDDATDDTNSSTVALGAAFDVSRALNANSVLTDLARADGLTGALSFPGPSRNAPFAGQAAMLKLRQDGDVLDRARVALFVMIGGGAWKDAGSRAAQWELLRAQFDEARKSLSVPATERVLNARDLVPVRAVLAGAMPLAIETNRESDVCEAAALADSYHIRIVIVGGAEAWRAADALAQQHIAVVLDPMNNLPQSFDQLGARQDNAALLTRAGVTVAFGLSGGVLEQTYNAGLDLREGAGLAVAAGLPYADALRAITINPRSIWGDADEPSGLRAGAAADLVVWDGDPLEMTTNPVIVMVDGHVASLATRQRLLGERYLSPRP